MRVRTDLKKDIRILPRHVRDNHIYLVYLIKNTIKHALHEDLFIHALQTPRRPQR